MTTVIFVAAGLFGIFSIWRALASGSATEDGRFRRDERPILYWSFIAIAVFLVGVFFYFAVVGIDA